MPFHLISHTCVLFINGLKDKLRPYTIEKYKENLLITTPINFTGFMASRYKNNVEDIQPEDIVAYKDILIKSLSPNSVRPRITAVKQFCHFIFNQKLVPYDYAYFIKNVRALKTKEHSIIPITVQEKVLSEKWGLNLFTQTRNHLIINLLLKNGLLPMEFISITEEDIFPLNNSAYIVVSGKKGKSRKVTLDKDTFNALGEYLEEYAHFKRYKKINNNSIFLSTDPKNNHRLEVTGIQAVVRNIKKKLNLSDDSSFNPQGCRRTALIQDYGSKVFIPENSLDNQYGLKRSPDHYKGTSVFNILGRMRK